MQSDIEERNAVARVVRWHAKLSTAAKLTLWLGLGALLIGGLALIRDLFDFKVDTGDTATRVTPTVGSTGSSGPDASSPAPAAGTPLPGYAAGRPGVLFPVLNPAASPTQVNFDPHNWSYTDNDDHGMTIECRHSSYQGGCKPNDRPVFYLDPVEPGATIAEATGATHSCAVSAYDSRAIPVQAGKTYCVKGNDWVLVVRVVALPTRVVEGDTVVPELHAQLWTQP
ncbi:hypothetical protein AB0G04_44010 [Actinoplanes sp. NPDC023801]|uniref:hypothetical protein n=1 Tax=Actinoplanes sp. NPDC023801 TaxID=3154595 RepID=UPI0033DEE167